MQLQNVVMDFNDWLSSLPGSPTPTIAANKAGLTNTTLIRHATKGQTTADNVIAIARAYGVRPVDALIATGHLEPEEAASERMAIRMALRSASIAEKWDSIAEDIDGMHVVVGHFPRAHELDIAKFDDTSTPDVSPIDDDDDAIIERINAGQEQIAAQKATDPLEENYT